MHGIRDQDVGHAGRMRACREHGVGHAGFVKACLTLYGGPRLDLATSGTMDPATADPPVPVSGTDPDSCC